MPNDGWVAEVLIADVEHRVSLVVSERPTAIMTDGEALRLVLAFTVVEGKTGNVGILPEACGVGRIDHNTACPATQSSRHILVDMAANLGKMDEIVRLGTSPPIAVVSPVAVDEAARVADPAPLWTEVILVAVVLIVVKVSVGSADA